ncbi:MAG: glutamate 5-kinase [Chloroflexota bacterium]|nr:glutamate 5-kinase [Chloroflexota bacterium]
MDNIIVVKVGTSTLTRGQKQINRVVVGDLARQIAAIQRGEVLEGESQPRQVILVSSAAIAMGREKLGRFPVESNSGESVITKQMLAAIGQPQLMQLYQEVFAAHYDVLTAQALLTYSDFSTPERRANARNTLLGLLSHNIVPIINENDVVATEEIKFGDNDRLSAMVAELVGAEFLVVLSDIEGLYTANPRLNPEARMLAEVERVDEQILAMAGGSVGGQGTGGMLSKVLAAKLATKAGITTIVVNGQTPDALLRAVAGEKLGTRFLVETSKPGEVDFDKIGNVV